MLIKENPRLVELRTAIILNYIANITDRTKVNNILYVLKSYVMAIDDEYGELFNNVLSTSINEELLGANKKELCLAMQVYYDSQNEIIKRLGVSYTQYKNLYPDMKKYATEEFIGGLEARFAIFNNYFIMCKLISNLFDDFDMVVFNESGKNKDLPRHVELKFMYMYNCINKYFGSTELTNRFIMNICRNLKIDTDIINEIISSKHLIYRLSEENITNNLGLCKELVTFGYIERWTKGKISTELLNKDSSYVSYNSIIGKDESDNEFFIYRFYKPTVLKDDKAVYEVQKLLKVMSDFNER